MIIGISGYIGSGKDLVGKIIQYLIAYNDANYSYPKSEYDFNSYCKSTNIKQSKWQIHKFADALKDIVCILTGCTREQLEDINFKNSKLSNEWTWNRGKRNCTPHSKCNEFNGPKCNNYYHCFRDVIVEYTYRDVLQKLGTDLLRNQLHENVWVNALFSKYKAIGDYPIFEGDKYIKDEYVYPNWIISDCRFPNEAQAIKERNGIIIRVQRNQDLEKFESMKVKHISETALDTYKFDYIIDNNSTIDDLIINVKSILISEKIIES